jgi:hypothetical protein
MFSHSSMIGVFNNHLNAHVRSGCKVKNLVDIIRNFSYKLRINKRLDYEIIKIILLLKLFYKNVQADSMVNT